EDLAGANREVDARNRLDDLLSRLEHAPETVRLDRRLRDSHPHAGYFRGFALAISLRSMSMVFRGWPEECQRFFIGLELNNSKKYFDAHRTTYEEAVKAPMVALIESLEAEYGPGKVFRANRDIRFSKDKSPYKTNI